MLVGIFIFRGCEMTAISSTGMFLLIMSFNLEFNNVP